MAIVAVPSEWLAACSQDRTCSDQAQVGLPYLRAKTQDLYEELGGGVSSDIMEEGLDVRQIRMLTDGVCSTLNLPFATVLTSL